MRAKYQRAWHGLAGFNASKRARGGFLNARCKAAPFVGMGCRKSHLGHDVSCLKVPAQLSVRLDQAAGDRIPALSLR